MNGKNLSANTSILKLAKTTKICWSDTQSLKTVTWHSKKRKEYVRIKKRKSKSRSKITFKARYNFSKIKTPSLNRLLARKDKISYLSKVTIWRIELLTLCNKTVKIKRKPRRCGKHQLGSSTLSYQMKHTRRYHRKSQVIEKVLPPIQRFVKLKVKWTTFTCLNH